MPRPYTSILITFYREEGVLKDTIESALSQGFSDTEILLVDNNASSENRAVAESYVSRYPKTVRLVHEPVQGVCSARNTGFRESRGTFIAILDGDDLMHPDRLALQRAVFDENPSLSVVSSWYDRVSMDNKTVSRANVRQTEPTIWLETEQILKELFPVSQMSGSGKTLHFPLTSTALFRREQALDAGGFNLAFNPRWYEDVEFFIRMHEMGEFQKVPASLVRYRISSPEAMEVKQKQMDWVGLCRQLGVFYQVLWERYGNSDSRTQKIFERLRALWYRHSSFYFLRYAKDNGLGTRMLSRSLKSNPRDMTTWKLWMKSSLPKPLHPRLFWFDSLNQDPLPAGADEQMVDRFFLAKE